jgi:hypothetical protein
MLKMPLAVVACLGGEVVLTKEFKGPCRTYPIGHHGTLTSIQHEDDRGLRFTVSLDADDPSYWETFRLDEIEPAGGVVSFSLDVEGGFLYSPPPQR